MKGRLYYMKIYFEDGKLRHYTQECILIEASDGPSKNISDLKRIMKENPNAIIYTNSIFAFSNDYAWNEELKVPEVYIRYGKYLKFTRIDELTNKELRKAHNIGHMYIAGAFN